MKTKLNLLLLILCFTSSWAQTVLTENMGTPTGTTAIVSNTFQNSSSLTYSNGAQAYPADVRITSASSGYTGASGNGNVYFTALANTYGFAIEGINAVNYTSLSLQFGYRKELATVHATFSVEYWNGTSWGIIANTSTALFNESASGTVGWYSSKVLSLPADAQINGLKIRFVKTGTNAIRIDDVKLTGVASTVTVTNTAVANITTNSATFAGNITATGGTSISANGTVFSSTAVSASPTLGSAGVTTLTTPNSGTGSYTIDSGAILYPNVQYAYNAFATKSNGTTNYGTMATFYTLAATPSAPIVTALTSTKLNVTIGSDTNTTATTYTILETTTGNYVQANGALGTTAVFQTKAQWSTKTVTGLTAATTYIFNAIAKNGAGINTLSGQSSKGTTLSAPIITTLGSLSALNTTYGTPSAFASFSVTASNLTGNILVTAPSGFEISQTMGGLTDYATNQVLVPNAGTLNATTLYVRLAATAAFGTYSGNISLVSSSDGLSISLPTASSTVNKLNLTITGLTVLNKIYDGNTTATLSGNPTLVGVIAGTSVTLIATSATASFADASVGTAKAVTVTGYSLSGTSANNYMLTQPSGLIADITPPSAFSDISLNSNSSTNSNSNIDYTLYQGTTLNTTYTGLDGSIGVLGFHLRDGGINLNDTDILSTELTDITFAVTNSANIRSARLFINSTPMGTAVPVNGASSISFSGLTGFVAADNTQLAINLRVTFNNIVTDNQQYQFTITSATAKDNGSKFAEANAGGISSTIANDKNRIEVIADRIAFAQLPSVTFVGNSMNPAPSVQGIDAYGNRDLDFTGTVSITSSGTLSSPQMVNATNGLATFNTINHTLAGSFSLVASVSGFSSVSSTSFDITPLLIPTFVQLGPICSGSSISLPTTSTNGITGTWSPDINNSVTTTYTFISDSGQNATNGTQTIVVNPSNSLTLSSGLGTNNQSPLFNTSIASITYLSTGATGALFSGLPLGLTNNFSSNTVTISGTPSVGGTFSYMVTLTGGCGVTKATGTITVKALPSVLYSSVNSSPRVNLTDLGIFRQGRLRSNVSDHSPQTWAFHIGSTSDNSPNYSVNWRPWTNNNSIAVNTFIQVGNPNGALYNSNSGGGDGKFIDSRSGYYYTFNVTEGVYNNNMEILETSYNPVTITKVSQNLAGNCIGSTDKVIITIETDSPPAFGENVFVRYSTGINFTTSTIVQAKFTGNIGKAEINAIPSGKVYYYAYSSNRTLTEIETKVREYGLDGQNIHDMATLSLKNDNGLGNFSYTIMNNPSPAIPEATTIIQPSCELPMGSVLLSNLPNTGWILYQNGNAIHTETGTGITTYTVTNLNPGTYLYSVSNNNCVSIAVSVAIF